VARYWEKGTVRLSLIKKFRFNAAIYMNELTVNDFLSF